MRILITGANRGIGLEMAGQALARGDEVLGTLRDPAKGQALAEVGAKVYQLDVTDDGASDALARTITGHLDLVICNAGMLNSYGGIDDPAHTREAWQNMMMTNVAGPFFTARAFLPHLQAAGGKLAIITSIMGSNEGAKLSGNAIIYRASKAAATNLACSLSAQLAPYGIAVGAYHPGWVQTDMGGSAADITPQESAAGLLERFDVLSMASTGVCEDYKGNALL